MSLTVRHAALGWLDSNFGERRRPVHASRFYIPEQSATRQSAWWLEIPLHEVETPNSAEIHLLCQKALKPRDFHYLKVPVKFLKKVLPSLDARNKGSVISLILSAEEHEKFVDKRGSGEIGFGGFEEPVS